MITLQNIGVSFKDKTVFKNISFNFTKDEKIVLMGQSGSGKSTLLKSIFGLIPLTSGSIFINNIELNAKNIATLRSQMVYIHQDIQFHAQTVWESIALILDFKNNKQLAYSNKRLLRIFERFNLPKELLTQDVQKLSGGEKQRLALVIAAYLKKPIWLLDEPVSALDKENKVLVAQELAKQKATIIIVSHDEVWNYDSFKIKNIEDGSN